MAITLEQVERLREKSSVSYEEAKAALEQVGGDMLEALILLERQGRINGGKRDNTFFTTRLGGDTPPTQPTISPAPKTGREKKTQREHNGAKAGLGDQIWEVLRNIWAVLRHSLANQFEVWRNNEMTTSMPVLILIILLCVAPWGILPALGVGLLFGCRYRFSGPDLNREKVNDVMGTVSATANDVVDNIRARFRKTEGDCADAAASQKKAEDTVHSVSSTIDDVVHTVGDAVNEVVDTIRAEFHKATDTKKD